MMFGFGSGQYITQLLAYLEIPNKFLCSNSPSGSNEYECAPYHTEKNNLPGFCDVPGVYHRVDWNQETSLYNWYT